MTRRDRDEWERIATRVDVRANETILPPAQELVFAVEEGRVRLAVPKRGEVTARKIASGDEEKRPYHFVRLIEAGDLFGWRPLRTTTDLIVDAAFVETLRPTRLWTVPTDLFAFYLRGRASWRMPAPFPESRRPFFHALGALVDAYRRRGGVALSSLWGRSANARIAATLLSALDAGWVLEGNAQRLRTRFTVDTLARRAGVEGEWARRWVEYARHEGVLTYRFGTWRIRRVWQLSRWAESRAMDFALDPPPDPVEQLEEGETLLGRASRNADGTTPSIENMTGVPSE